MRNMNDEAKKRVDELCDKPYSALVEQLKKGSITDTLVDADGNIYQLEINIIWDDEKEGIIRVSAFVDGGPNRRWWNSFFGKSTYERIIYPKI